MDNPQTLIRPYVANDRETVVDLEVRAFGPGRFVRTAYRIREQADDDSAFCLVAEIGSGLVGSICFTDVSVGGEMGVMLLGPLVVDPNCLGKGAGRELVAAGLHQVRAQGKNVVLLVGDVKYYGRFGFEPCPYSQVFLPGPVDPRRLLWCAFEDDDKNNYSGLVEALR